MSTTVFIEKERCDHVRAVNDSGSDVVQYEFAIIGPYAAVADEAIASLATGSFHVEEGIQIQTDDLESGYDTFATPGQPVYWNGTNFQDTAVAEDYFVGYLLEVKDSTGKIVFEKVRYAEEVPS